MKKTMEHLPKNLKNLVAVLMPKWYNMRFCATNGLWNDYFEDAEAYMDKRWNEIIWPLIRDFDFEAVLEIAPGAGRNTEKLAQISNVIYAVDLNEYALEQCRRRLQNYSGHCKLYFYKNKGNNLDMIEDSTITIIYCWDAAVHFDKAVMRDYIKEFSRVLRINGRGFIHHSNLGASARVDISENPGWRSNMSKELFREYCEENGLEIVNQIDIDWAKTTDCISIFRKGIAC